MHKQDVLQVGTLPVREWSAILRLSVSSAQRGFLESAQQCLTDARTNAYDMRWQFYGITVQNTLIGFAMHGLQYLEDGAQSRLWLDRFMIDASWQGRGWGKRAMEIIIEKLLQEYACNTIYLSVHQENVTAIALYEKLGFRQTAHTDPHGERIMVRGEWIGEH